MKDYIQNSGKLIPLVIHRLQIKQFYGSKLYNIAYGLLEKHNSFKRLYTEFKMILRNG